MKQYLDVFKLNEYQYDQLQKYYQLLVSTNEKFNLTTIISFEDVVIKHFYDALALFFFCQLTGKGLDLGSGAGVPGILLKIVEKNMSIVLLEPTNKKAQFLKHVVDELCLSDVVVINERIENLDLFKKYDWIVTRAVASLHILIELAIPYLTVGGKLYAYKGSNYQEEIDNAFNALKRLNAVISGIHHYQLPNECGTRVIIEITKEKTTASIYPRTFAKIKKQPL